MAGFSDRILAWSDGGSGNFQVFDASTGTTGYILCDDVDHCISGIVDPSSISPLAHNAAVRLQIEGGFTTVRNDDGTIKAEVLALLNTRSFKVPA